MTRSSCWHRSKSGPGIRPASALRKWDHGNKVENAGLSPVAQSIWNTHWRGEWLKEADNLLYDKERELRMLLYNRWLVGRRSSGMMEHFVTQFPDYILSHNLLLYYFESYSYPLVCYLEKNGWNNIWQDRCLGSGTPYCV